MSHTRRCGVRRRCCCSRRRCWRRARHSVVGARGNAGLLLGRVFRRVVVRVRAARLVRRAAHQRQQISDRIVVVVVRAFGAVKRLTVRARATLQVGHRGGRFQNYCARGEGETEDCTRGAVGKRSNNFNTLFAQRLAVWTLEKGPVVRVQARVAFLANKTTSVEGAAERVDNDARHQFLSTLRTSGLRGHAAGRHNLGRTDHVDRLALQSRRGGRESQPRKAQWFWRRQVQRYKR